MVSDSRDRGQLILIGAIALAFIILGIVVVFNGVVYTETLSSGSTSQSATTAEKTELEIDRGIGCLIHEVEQNGGGEDEVREAIIAFNDAYQNSTAHSTPAVANISVHDDGDGIDDPDLNFAEVTITYDSNDLHYEQTQKIDARDCNS